MKVGVLKKESTMSTSEDTQKQTKVDSKNTEKKMVKIVREDQESIENGSSHKNGKEVNISVPSKKIVDELFKDFISQNKTNIPTKQIPTASSKSLDQMNAILDREISLISTQKSESAKSEDNEDEEGELHEDSSSTQIVDRDNVEENPSVEPHEEPSEEKSHEKDKSSKKKHKKEKHKSKRHKDEESSRHSSRSKHKKKHKSDDGSPRRSSSKKKQKRDRSRSPQENSSKRRHGSGSRASSKTKDNEALDNSKRRDNRSSCRPSEERSASGRRDHSRSKETEPNKKDHGIEMDFKIRVGADENREVLPETVNDSKNASQSLNPEKKQNPPMPETTLSKDMSEESMDNKKHIEDSKRSSVENSSSAAKEKSSHKKHKRDRDGTPESTSSRKKHKKKHRHESSEERRLRKEEKKVKRSHERDHPTFEDIHDHLDRHEESMENDDNISNRNSNRDTNRDSDKQSNKSEKHSAFSEKKSDSKDKLDAFDKMKQIFEKVKRGKGQLKDSDLRDKGGKNVEKVRVTKKDLKVLVDRNKRSSNFIKDDNDDDDVIFVDKVDEPINPIVIDDDSSVTEASAIPLPALAPAPLPAPAPETIPLPITVPVPVPSPDKIPLPSTTTHQTVPQPEQIPLPDQNIHPSSSIPVKIPPALSTEEPIPPSGAFVQPVPPPPTIPLPVAPPSLSESFELSAIPLPLTKTKPEPVKLGLSLKISNDLAEFIASGEKIDKKGKRREEGEVTSESGEETSNDESSSSDGGEIEDNGNVSETGSLPDSDDEKSKKKKKKHKKKKKKNKKKESDKERSKKKKESKSRDSRERSKERDRKRSKRDRSRSKSRSSEQIRRESNDVLDRGWDAYSYSDNFSGLGFHGKDSRYRRSRSRSRSRSRRSTSRSRSRRDRSSSKHSKSRRSRSRSRRSSSRSKSKKKKDESEDLRFRIDKKKLRKIAIANALANLKSGNMSSADLASFKAGGKSVEELTDFCKGLAGRERGKYSSSDSDSPLNSDDEHDAPFINHPFIVREAAPIIMNIRNSKQLPVMTATDKNVGILRSQFPVSSGNQHRLKELEWVPVEKTTAPPTATTTTTTKPTAPSPVTATESTPSTSGATPAVASVVVDPVFPKPVSLSIDIGAIVSERLQAVRKLQENPYDVQALTKMHKSQERASQWATSQYQPGTFTGSTGVQILSKQELEGTNKYNKAWLKKDQFKKAEPVKSGIGMFLLQKMGWKAGEGLGKNNEGSLEPLLLDLKVDRKGLQTHSEVRGNQRGSMKGGIRRGGGAVGGFGGGNSHPRDLSGKHPVSALLEICNKRKFGAPYFELVHESGPDHKKHFLFKVLVNGVEYQPSIASNNKKTAKSQAATVCLQELGMLPRSGPI